MNMPMEMATSGRHNDIINSIIGELYGLIKPKKILVRQSDCSLVYWGKRTNLDTVKLVEINKLTDEEYFRNEDIYNLRCVEPDFMLFEKNKYIETKHQTRLAGFPDLVIEVWSEGNTDDDKIFKKFLYSTSDKVEHWYIMQRDNNIECYLGQNPLPPQSLTDILQTQNGIEIDLRHMAVKGL
ncbi:MAG: Uma2 family endonuclease [Oscillospiraceae bacterium]|nr:Uma2 family endonuclease [Oscillospiraceae bacterium]